MQHNDEPALAFATTAREIDVCMLGDHSLSFPFFVIECFESRTTQGQVGGMREGRTRGCFPSFIVGLIATWPCSPSPLSCSASSAEGFFPLCAGLRTVCDGCLGRWVACGWGDSGGEVTTSELIPRD